MASTIQFEGEAHNKGTLHIYSDDSETFVYISDIRELLSRLNSPIPDCGVYVGHSEGHTVMLYRDGNKTKLVCEAYDLIEEVHDLADVIRGRRRHRSV